MITQTMIRALNNDVIAVIFDLHSETQLNARLRWQEEVDLHLENIQTYILRQKESGWTLKFFQKLSPCIVGLLASSSNFQTCFC